MPPGFKRADLQPRYDVRSIREDAWHSFSEEQTNKLLTERMSGFDISPRRFLNAGSGGQRLRPERWSEICLDLFSSPLAGRFNSVCASVERLPFSSCAFGCVICVGEVLGDCDPAAVFAEFARVLVPGGLLICDFSSSTSFRHSFTTSFGRAADLVTDHYNGSPERIWMYDPFYIRELLKARGFRIESQIGIHKWSALVRRFGASPKTAVRFKGG